MMMNTSNQDTVVPTPSSTWEKFTNSSSNISNASESECHAPVQASTAEFYLVAVFGTTIAIVSIIENVSLFYLLISRSKFHTSSLFYLTFLAFFDIFTGACYITLITVQIMKDYFLSTVLSAMWHFYLRPMMALSQSTMTASTYIIVAATLERFLCTVRVNFANFFNRRRRTMAVIVAILGGFITKGAVFWELKVLRNDNCEGMARYEATLSDLVRIELYEIVWRFWSRNILTIFLPFAALAYMNGAIVRNLRRQSHPERTTQVAMVCVGLGGTEYVESRVKIRRATRMLVSVVTTYLVTNLLNLVLTAWEHVDSESLYSPTIFPFYSYGVDMVSIFVVVCCAVRLPIYCWCNSEIRVEVYKFFGGPGMKFTQNSLTTSGIFEEVSCGEKEGDELLEMRKSKQVAEQKTPLVSGCNKLEANGVKFYASVKQNGANIHLGSDEEEELCETFFEMTV